MGFNYELREDSRLTQLVRRIRVALRIPQYWHDDPRNEPPGGAWVWHVHHETLVERNWSFGDMGRRASYIRAAKPLDEIATRLRLLTVVKDQAGLNAAHERANAARRTLAYPAHDVPEFDFKRQAYYDRSDEIDHDFWAEVNAIHHVEHPDCPWDGRTIFPDKGA